MPLKHKIESRLILLLAFAVALSGVLTSSLPAFPLGAGPWALCFVLFILYPIFLHPTLKKNRADYEFRMLHWIPAGILALWFVLQILYSVTEKSEIFSRWMTWAWALPLVSIGFFLLIVFCLHVIRRRTSRIFLLALLFIPYASMALLSEQTGSTHKLHFASVLWNEDFWFRLVPVSEKKNVEVVAKSDSKIITARDVEKKIDRSDDSKEEAWRASLRAFQERMERLRMDDNVPEVVESENNHLPVQLQPGGTGAHIREIYSKPNHLPESGFGWNAFILIMLSVYCGVLHDRLRKRVY